MFANWSSAFYAITAFFLCSQIEFHYILRNTTSFCVHKFPNRNIQSRYYVAVYVRNWCSIASTHLLRCRLCSQTDAPPQSTQPLCIRLCSIEEPPQSTQLRRIRLCSQIEEPPQSTHSLRFRLCSHIEEPPQSTQLHVPFVFVAVEYPPHRRIYCVFFVFADRTTTVYAILASFFVFTYRTSTNHIYLLCFVMFATF
jgi:hypothetical protein